MWIVTLYLQIYRTLSSGENIALCDLTLALLFSILSHLMHFTKLSDVGEFLDRDLFSDGFFNARVSVNAAYVQLVLPVYKVTAVFNKVKAAKSRVTTDVRVSTAGWIKWLEDQDMRVNEIY
uniref:Uncharacterized protein n=1 Tax=Tanacetum cinerariifolium TaxID=118510 RepID=A0A6L2JW20_TANCI|nr:hypothetical protein [Tanacetum cinerariifolium]